MNEFHLARSDLDSILPISVEPNPRGGPYDVIKYNRSDVEALARDLKSGEARISSRLLQIGDSQELAKPKPGGKILRTKAINEYGVRMPFFLQSYNYQSYNFVAFSCTARSYQAYIYRG